MTKANSDAQAHRGASAQKDADAALLFRQRAAGKGYNHGIVARQQKVNPDDLGDCQKVCGAKIHGISDLFQGRWERG